jgi:hypothetical protein
MTGSHSVPSRAPHVEIAHLDGEAVLYDTERVRPVLLNSTAAAVWAALDGLRSPAEIGADLAIQFNAEPSQVAADVAAALASFDELGLLFYG